LQFMLYAKGGMCNMYHICSAFAADVNAPYKA